MMKPACYNPACRLYAHKVFDTTMYVNLPNPDRSVTRMERHLYAKSSGGRVVELVRLCDTCHSAVQLINGNHSHGIH